jgi:predicted outer membrane repeat protein
LRPVLLLSLLLASAAHAADRTVGPGQTYATIQAAVNASADGDVLRIAAGTYDEAITIAELDLSLVAQGAVTLIHADDSILRIEEAVVDITGITFVPDGGRALRLSDAEVTITNVTIRDNNTGQDPFNGAAAALFAGSSLTARNSTFRNNRTYANFYSWISQGYGGHIYVDDSDLLVEDCTFEAGEALRGGGIFHSGTGTTTIRRSTFSGLSATARGGAVWLSEAASLVVEDSTFTSNEAEEMGGAIRWEGQEGVGSLTISNSRFTSNSADDYGGAIAVNTGNEALFEAVVFRGNTSDRGGAISLTNLEAAEMLGNVFCGNAANTEGGAVRANNVDAGTWKNNAFYQHAAGGAGGGALWVSASDTALVLNNTFLGSRSTGPGGAILLASSGADVRNNLFAYGADGVALVSQGGGSSLSQSYNAWFSNTDGDLTGGTPGTGSLTVDPQILAFTADNNCDNDDGHLSQTSPLIDAGDPSILDPDSSRSDIGAFGGDGADPTLFTDGDGDGFVGVYDCDDDDATVYPGGVEVCDDKDNNCDGAIDAPNAIGATTWYPDDDGDSYGVLGSPTLACDAPADHVSRPGDCDDANAEINPGAQEVCDGVDNDCNGSADGTDARDQLTWYLDADDDGYGTNAQTVASCTEPEGYALTPTDCDDTDAEVRPNGVERCNDADDDCDGTVDDDAADALVWYADVDLDGYAAPGAAEVLACDRPEGFARADTDCDDADDAIYPGAPESCDPPLTDSNCDGSVGDADKDGDGFIACEDCDDDDATAYPDAPEVYYDGLIKDCTSSSDFDADRDGFETDVFGGTDCDDGDATVSPGATEVFGNEVDENCDGEVGVDEQFEDEDVQIGCSGCAQRSGGPSVGWLALVVLGLLRRRSR